jgi:hypothetical protein
MILQLIHIIVNNIFIIIIMYDRTNQIIIQKQIS